LSKYIKRKTKYNKGVTRTEDCQVTSQFPLDHVDIDIIAGLVRCSPTQFDICQKTGCEIRYFLSFETENWKCWLWRKFIIMWAQFYWPTYF